MDDSVADTTPPSATLLRGAAALMRQRANPLPQQLPWKSWGREVEHRYRTLLVASPRANTDAEPLAVHVASWHPAVALAVADLLDYHADHFTDARPVRTENALRVARAYLGRPS